MRSLIPRHAIALWCVSSLLLGVSTVAAQGFHLSSADVADSAALATSMSRLAAQVLGTYRDADRLRLLDNLFGLQILTGRYSEAWASLAELRTLRRKTTPPARAQYVQYGVFLRARTLAASTGRPFPDTFTDAFRETFGRLDDPTAALAARAIPTHGRERPAMGDAQPGRQDHRLARGGATTAARVPGRGVLSCLRRSSRGAGRGGRGASLRHRNQRRAAHA